MLGIHTPEFDHERSREAVAREVGRHRLDYPQLLDNDFAYWNALGNRYWPTTYLVDRCGRIRVRHIGEVHADQPSGLQLERELRVLLDESAACPGATPPAPPASPE